VKVKLLPVSLSSDHWRSYESNTKARGFSKVLIYQISQTSYLVVEKPFKKGEHIATFNITEYCEPAWCTIQVSKDKHVNIVEPLLYMNHSCNPSVNIDTSKGLVISNRDLSEGDAVTYFYPSTEWKLAQPFDCWCGSQKCLKTVSGAIGLNVKSLRKEYFFNQHILELSGVDSTEK
jgi:hypothetical protein